MLGRIGRHMQGKMGAARAQAARAQRKSGPAATKARAHFQRNQFRYGMGAAGATGFGLTYGRWQPGSNAYNNGRRRSMGTSSGATGTPPRSSMGGYA